MYIIAIVYSEDNISGPTMLISVHFFARRTSSVPKIPSYLGNYSKTTLLVFANWLRVKGLQIFPDQSQL